MYLYLLKSISAVALIITLLIFVTDSPPNFIRKRISEKMRKKLFAVIAFTIFALIMALCFGTLLL